MAYKFRVGQETVNEVLKEIKKAGQDADLAENLKNFNAGTSVDQNNILSQEDPGLQNFTATSDLEIDSASLEAIQDLIRRKDLDKASNLLKKVLIANPVNCNPPYDCGNTLLN